jgi:hypothetical protein
MSDFLSLCAMIKVLMLWHLLALLDSNEESYKEHVNIQLSVVNVSIFNHLENKNLG